MTGKASTEINPDLGSAIDQAILAEGRVEDLTLLVGAGGPDARRRRGELDRGGEVRRRATSQPQFSGDSRVADLTLGGTPIPSISSLTSSTNILNPLLGALVEIKVDERIQTADSLTINALHVKVLRGSTPLVDLIVGQAKVAASRPRLRPDAGRTTARAIRSARSVAAGSVLDVDRNLCVIPAGTSGSGLGEIIIGRPSRARAVAASSRSTSPAGATAAARA